MESQLPPPSSYGEGLNNHPENGNEVDAQNHPQHQIEKTPEVAGETRERVRDSVPDPAPASPPPAQAPALPALPAVDPASNDDQTVTDDSNPSVASDDDLIEKEWVEKAKKVIAETRHDPYLQEHEISKLQADYLKKRYGKDVSVPSDA